MEACRCQALCWPLGTLMNEAQCLALGHPLLRGGDTDRKYVKTPVTHPLTEMRQEGSLVKGSVKSLPFWGHSCPAPAFQPSPHLSALTHRPVPVFSFLSRMSFPAFLLGNA